MVHLDPEACPVLLVMLVNVVPEVFVDLLVLRVLLENLVPQVAEVCLALTDLQVLKVKMETEAKLVQLVPRVNLEILVVPEPQVFKVSEVLLVEEVDGDLWVRMENKENLDKMEKMGNLDHKDYLAFPVLWVLEVIRDLWENRELREILDLLVYKDLEVILARMVFPVQLDLMDPLARLEKEEHQEVQDQEVSRECQDLQEKMECLERMENRVCKDHQA